MKRWGFVLGLGSALLLAPSAHAVEPDAPGELISRADAVFYAIQDKLTNRAKEIGADKPEQLALSAFYASPSTPLLWMTEEGGTARVAQLRKVFAQAEDWGLTAADYAIPAEAEDRRRGGYPADAVATAELRTSLAAILYARHAQIGRVDPLSLDEEFLDLRPARPDPLAVLKGIADSGDRLAGFMEVFHPPHEQFRLLKQKLAELRGRGGPARNAVRIPGGPQLKPGQSHPQVALLRQRLSVPASRDVMSDGAPEEYFDEELADAVRDFQASTGIAGRGVLNTQTREALNKGVARADVNEILVNMERWRWEPRDFGPKHLYVNIPEYLVRLSDRGQVVYEERIVTGSPQHRTPVFSDEMEFVVFNPYWNVPESILVKEVIPAARRNPEYFSRNRMEVVWQGSRTVDPYMVDWEEVNPKKVTLRQTPGPGNALGQVKFLFPNKHSVYMHDTPTKHLFAQSSRAFSHGCMRVRNPLKFAEVLLSDQGWGAQKVKNAVDTTEDFQVTLERKVPVHIMYFTVWMDRNGGMREFTDVYEYDDRLKTAMRLQGAPKARPKAQQNYDSGEHGLGN